MSFLTMRRRRALAAGVLLVALGAAAVSTNLTGAWFTASSASPVTVTGALLSIGEIGKASDKTTIAVSDVYPMTDAQALANAVGVQAKSEWVTVRNTGTIPLDWSMQIVNPVGKAPLTASQLAMFRFQLFTEAGVKLTEPLTLGSRPSAAVPDGGIASGAGLAAGAQSKVEIRVWLDASADNAFQGAGASFDVVINAIQNGAGGLPTAQLLLKATSSGSPVGAATDLSWSDIGTAVRSVQPSAAVRYTVERSASGDFSDSVAVYSGPDNTVRDANGGAPAGVVELSQSMSGACAVTNAGAVYCWGAVTGGRLGNGTSDEQNMKQQASPVLAGGALAGKRAVDVETGLTSSCAITDVSSLYCWGWAPGDGGRSSTQTTPVAVDMSQMKTSTVKQVDVSGSNGANCLLTRAGEVGCWGNGYYGMNGTETTQTRPRPIVDGALTGKTVVSIAGSSENFCALTTDNVIACWGLDIKGSLGIGTGPFPNYIGVNSTHASLKPIAVLTGQIPAGTAFTRLTSHPATICADAVGGDHYCWGMMGGGVDAKGNLISTTSPTKFVAPGLDRFDSLYFMTPPTTMSPYGRVCAVSDGQLFCWGSNENGGLGLGLSTVSPFPIVATPTRVSQGLLATRRVVQAQADGISPCALLEGGVVTCWGYTVGGAGIRSTPDTQVTSAGFAATCAGGSSAQAGVCPLSTGTAYTYRVRGEVSSLGWATPWTTAVRSN